jgi:signal transduction histidine kinase
MRAEELFQHLAEGLYVAIFVAVLVGALRRLTRVRLDLVLFFGDAALIVIASTLVRALSILPVVAVTDLETALLMALPYLLLRLVGDFMAVPAWLMRGAELGLLVAVVLLVVPAPLPLPLTLVLVAYFVGLSLYAALAFWRGARRSSGVTRRRFQAVALGSGFLGLDILVAGLGAALPAQADLWGVLGPLCGMASGLAYVLGFTPPTWLRRAWQEPEVRAFLGRAATLPHLPDTHAIVAELERGAAAATGGSGATIGLFDEHADALRFFDASPQRAHAPVGVPAGGEGFQRTPEGWRLAASARAISARALRERRVLLAEDVAREDPANAAAYAAYGATAALAAPITAGQKRLGVLVVYAPRAPLFADSDLELVQLLADQAAVILESRTLLDAAAAAQARAEAGRLKEDFLSSAAHDLKTPIAGILAQAQVLQRQLDQHPGDPRAPTGLARIVREARRLRALVLELLDASLLDQGRLLSTRESVDLVEVASAVCARYARGPVPCRVEAAEAVVGWLDPARVRQLIEHLIDNAIRFSPPGAEVVVRLWREADAARLDVVDRGIGIPPEDVPRLFERFHRGANVDDRRFAGLGLGLYLSRGIAEAHGGRIWATSTPDGGSTFSVRLPLQARPTAAAPAPAAGRAWTNG